MLGCNQTYIQPNANVVVTFSVSWVTAMYIPKTFFEKVETYRCEIKIKSAMTNSTNHEVVVSKFKELMLNDSG